MTQRRMWFGNVAHAQWVPVPLTGMTRSYEGNGDEFALDNGGLWIDDTGSDHAVYNMEYGITDKGYEGIEAFVRFKNGSYGKVSRLGRDGYLHFVDPMRSSDNLFNQVWAEPGIAERSDWKSIADSTPTFSDVAANSWHMPLRKAVFPLTMAANALPAKANSVFTLLIPPTHSMYLGAAGSLTGTGKIRVQPVNLDGILATVVDIVPAADTAQPALSASFSGATYRALRVYLTRTSTADSTATITAMWAQCWPIGSSPVMARHIPGLGHSGCKFRGSSRVDTYLSAVRRQISASLVLAEVEPWAP